MEGSPHARVGLAYHPEMLLHTPPDSKHDEQPVRIKCIIDKLKEIGIYDRCTLVDVPQADYSSFIKETHDQNVLKKLTSKKISKTKQYSGDYYCSAGTGKAAFSAASLVIELCRRVLEGDLSSGFAVVRPPGHHASRSASGGFCLINNVAIACNYLISEKNLQRILIVDWDYHQGDGTSRLFRRSKNVLVISVHRHDTYPSNGKKSGGLDSIGEGDGKGFNVNVPLLGNHYKDVDYRAIWNEVVIPVATEFNPEFVIISAGFDSAAGDSVGDFDLSPTGYSWLLKQLLTLAAGKVVLALEGGYVVENLQCCTAACMQTLFGEDVLECNLQQEIIENPKENTLKVIEALKEKLHPYWASLVGTPLSPKLTLPSNARNVFAEQEEQTPLNVVAVAEPLNVVAEEEEQTPLNVVVEQEEQTPLNFVSEQEEQTPLSVVAVAEPLNVVAEEEEQTPLNVVVEQDEQTPLNFVSEQEEQTPLNVVAVAEPLNVVAEEEEQTPLNVVVEQEDQTPLNFVAEPVIRVTPSTTRRKRKSKKKSNKSVVTYNFFIRKVLKKVHPELSISRKSITIMNDCINDILEKLADEAVRVASINPNLTVTEREMRTAARLVLRGELAKHAIDEAENAVTKFIESNV